MIRERIFSSVLLPAPLRPMMPTTSPARMSKSMFLSAQNSLMILPTITKGVPEPIDDRFPEIRRAIHIVGNDVRLAQPADRDGKVLR